MSHNKIREKLQREVYNGILAEGGFPLSQKVVGKFEKNGNVGGFLGGLKKIPRKKGHPLHSRGTPHRDKKREKEWSDQKELKRLRERATTKGIGLEAY